MDRQIALENDNKHWVCGNGNEDSHSGTPSNQIVLIVLSLFVVCFGS